MSERVSTRTSQPFQPARSPATGVPEASPSPDQTLDPANRALFKPRLGRDFGQVRVHAGVAERSQPALTVGPPGDRYELEADRVADHVLRTLDPDGGELHLRPTQDKEAIQARVGPGHTPEVSPELETRIRAIKGGGHPIPGTTRAYLSNRFGCEFSQVRLHTSAPAEASARELGAQAYTVGTDIAFGHGQYAPEAPTGLRLLAHELAHVVQQRRGASPQIRMSVPHDPPLETPQSEEVTKLVVESDDPLLDGRPADEVAAELRGMLRSYRDGVDTFQGSALQMVRAEQRWALKLNIFGSLVELVNGVELPDPVRWDDVFALWDEVAVELDSAVAVAAPEMLADAGQQGRAALELFDQAFALGQSTSDEFLAYMQGFQGAAETVHTFASVGRDIAFCALLTGTVVIAAPVIAGAGLGTAATVGATTLAMGLTGAGLEADARAGAALVVETIDLGHDLLVEGQSWDAALDDVDWALVTEEGIDGLQKGFIDGVLTYASMGVDKFLAGAGPAATKLKPVGSALIGRLLRTALVRATAAGASGAVIGALDAGAKATIAGAGFDGVTSAMRDGFLIGAAAGAVLGGAGGAISEALAARLRSEMAVLPALLVDNPEEFASRYKALVESLTPEQRAAWDTEMQGRRFVDKEFFDPAKAQFDAGSSVVPPEHQFGQQPFEDWKQAAALLDEHARSGRPLTQEELRLAHEAAMDWKLSADPGELRTEDVLAGGQVGFDKLWSVLSPEQLTILRRNPVINLLDVGAVDPALTLRQRVDGFTTAIIAYPPQQFVQDHLDEFFKWYAAALNTMDATTLAATAQRRLVSIHPFLDGNGRVSRLVMDDALQRSGLPPALLADPNLDFMVTKKAWIAEVRAGVVEAYEITAQHADIFNSALQRLDVQAAAATWAAILGLTSDPDALTGWLYPDAVASDQPATY